MLIALTALTSLVGCDRAIEQAIVEPTWEAVLEGYDRPLMDVQGSEPFALSGIHYASEGQSIESAMQEFLVEYGFSVLHKEFRLSAGTVSIGNALSEVELLSLALRKDDDAYVAIFEVRSETGLNSGSELLYNIRDVTSFVDDGGVCSQLQDWYMADISDASEVCDRIANLPPMAGLVLLSHARLNMLARSPINVARDDFVQQTLMQYDVP